MSNLVKKSLEDNLDEILENLPEEFHNDLKESIKSAAPTPVLSKEEAKAAAIENLKEDPYIDDAECIPMLEADSSFGETVPRVSEADLAAQEKSNLAEVQAGLGES